MRYITREEWNAAPAKRPNPGMRANKVKGIAVHIIQGGNLQEVEGVRRMPNIQRYHQVTHGWSDIAYAWGLDFKGTVYEGQKLGSTGFAEGTSRSGGVLKHRHNGEWISILCLAGTDNVPSPEMIQGFQELARFIEATVRRAGGTKQLEIRGHCEILFNKVPGDIKPCPGRNWLEVIHSRDWFSAPVAEQKPAAPAWWDNHPDFLGAVELELTDGTRPGESATRAQTCLLYTSDAADE